MVPLSSAPARTLRWQLGEPVTLRRDQRAATSPRAAPGGRSCRCSRRALSPEADPGRERTLPPNGATDSRGNSWVNRTLAPWRVAPEALIFSHFLMVRGPNPVCRAMSPIEAPAFRKAWICACLVRCRCSATSRRPPGPEALTTTSSSSDSGNKARPVDRSARRVEVFRQLVRRSARPARALVAAGDPRALQGEPPGQGRVRGARPPPEPRVDRMSPLSPRRREGRHHDQRAGFRCGESRRNP